MGCLLSGVCAANCFEEYQIKVQRIWRKSAVARIQESKWEILYKSREGKCKRVGKEGRG